MLSQQIVTITAGILSASILFFHTQPEPQVLGSTTTRVAVSPVPAMTNTPTPTMTSTPTPTFTPTPTSIPTPTFTPSPTPTATPLPPSAYEEHFDTYSTQYGIDKNILKQ